MPPLGEIIGGVNFSDLAVSMGADPAGKAVLIKYGLFLQTIFDFVIIAIVLFICIKGINKLKKPRACGVAAPPPPPPKSEVLLEQIRDLLAKDSAAPRVARKSMAAHRLKGATPWHLTLALAPVLWALAPARGAWAEEASASAAGRLDRQGTIRVLELARQQRRGVAERRARPVALRWSMEK